MSLVELQTYLSNTGRYDGRIDGLWGRLTESAILEGFEDGPDTALTDDDFRGAALRLGVRPAYICAFWEVEAAGAGFQDGFPKILPEPHIFSRLTGGRFNASHPTISYSRWGARPYPRTQRERYAVLLQMIRLDNAAGFSAASYGAPQILGSNHAACGYDTAHEFAFAMALDEPTQLKAFEQFIRNAGILPHLRVGDWSECARRYNGPAYKRNQYDVKLARAANRHAQRLAA